MPLTLSSTIQDILDQFVVLDPAYPEAEAQLVTDDTTIKLLWPDTSRVRLDISTMSVVAGGIKAVTPPFIQAPGGENTNNPPPPAGPPPVLTTLTPDTVAHGGTGFTLTIEGTGFVDHSKVSFGTAVGYAVFVSDTEVNFTVDDFGYTEAGTVQVSVTEPGGNVSNQLPFVIS